MSSTQSKGIILITGLNGYLAGRTAEAVLRAGYSVRGTVRNLESGFKVRDALVSLGFDANWIEVVHVSDITAPGAFDDAVAGCTSILHVAAPVSDVIRTPPNETVAKGRDSVITLLESAAKEHSSSSSPPLLRSVILMSSTAAVLDTPAENRRHYVEKDWNTTSEAAIAALPGGGDLPPPGETDKEKLAVGFVAYCAGKTTAEREFWRFGEERKPRFGMGSVQATYFIGPPLVPWGTPDQVPFCTWGLWPVVNGQDPQTVDPMPTYQSTVDVRDVARVLVWSALNQPPISSSSSSDSSDSDSGIPRRLLCDGGTGGSQAVADILRRYLGGEEGDGGKNGEQADVLKEAAKNGKLVVQEGVPGKGYNADYTPKEGEVCCFENGPTIRVTGQDFIPFETSVLDSARAMVRCLL